MRCPLSVGLAILFLVAVTARAEVHVCIEHGQKVFRSDPCSPGTDTGRSYIAPPVRVIHPRSLYEPLPASQPSTPPPPTYRPRTYNSTPTIDPQKFADEYNKLLTAGKDGSIGDAMSARDTANAYARSIVPESPPSPRSPVASGPVNCMAWSNGDSTCTTAKGETYNTMRWSNGDSTTFGPHGESYNTLKWRNGDSTTSGPRGETYNTTRWGNGDTTIVGPDGRAVNCTRWLNGDTTCH